MRIGVLGQAGGWYLGDLRRAAGCDYEILPLAFTGLAASLDQSGDEVRADGGARPADCQAVLVRTMPPGTLEQVVFRMNALAQWERAGTLVINPARALEIAVDKYLALARLREAGLPTPATWVGQGTDAALTAFETLGGDVVVKPLFGSEGRGILRVSDPDLAWRVFKSLERTGSVLYLQEFVPHAGFDVRVLWLGDRGWAIRRHHASDWRTNVSRGATASACELDDALATLSQSAMRATGALVAGIDLLPTADGRLLLLEVNAVPGWRGLARAHGCDIARALLDYGAQVAAARQGG